MMWYLLYCYAERFTKPRKSREIRSRLFNHTDTPIWDGLKSRLLRVHRIDQSISYPASSSRGYDEHA